MLEQQSGRKVQMNIGLTISQYERLKVLSAETKVPVAELVRMAVEDKWMRKATK